MEYIRKILESDNITLDSLIKCAEQIKVDGNIIAIKLDGQREQKQYTVLISFAQSTQKEIIRSDESNLEAAIIKALKEYVA